MDRINVTQPTLPPLDDFVRYLERIWGNKWLTNNGPLHVELEAELAKYLGVDHLSLFSNGTIALITALQALRITGEVITTPFSFVATTHALWWNNIRPVFVDIDPETLNLDPDRIEAAITPRTTAIMPVHVYGTPCAVIRLEEIARRYNLRLIYDAAHAFGVRVGGRSILEFGDLSILSFHATKVYSTIEGGAIVSKSAEMKQRIDLLKNFGFVDETTVIEPGINGKMNEVQAAFGLLQLKHVDEAIKRREDADARYRVSLAEIPGIDVVKELPTVTKNYSYMPIIVDEGRYGKSRDALYEGLKKFNIYSRRYFYPLISQFPTYRGLESSTPANLPVATSAANRVLCLPMSADLTDQDVTRVVDAIKAIREE